MLLFILIGLIILCLIIKPQYETFDVASEQDILEGASPIYNWGKPKIRKEKVVKEKCIDRKICENISECDITKHKDLHKYVLKSSVPPCPNMSKYILKSKIPSYPDMSKYILKSEIPAYPDMSKYILKSEIPNCPKQLECPYCPECKKCEPIPNMNRFMLKEKCYNMLNKQLKPNDVINRCLQ